jgi:predicted permease
MQALFRRVRHWFRRDAITDRFDEELAFHLEQREVEFRRKGLSPTEARSMAQRELGNRTQAREQLYEQAGFPVLEGIWRDVLLSVRSLCRRPLFTVGVIAVIASGLAAAALVYGVIDAVFLLPLPVPRPTELNLVFSEGERPAYLSYGTVRRMEDLLPPAHAGGCSESARCKVRVGNKPISRTLVRFVTGRFFSTLQISAEKGSLFSVSADTPGHPAPIVVVSAARATEWFGSPSAALNQEILVNDQPVTIVGVLPKEFVGLSPEDWTDLWMPASLQNLVHVSVSAYSVSRSDRPNLEDISREERVAWLQLLLRLPSSEAINPVVAITQAYAPQREDLEHALAGEPDGFKLFTHSWQVIAAPGGFSHFRNGFRSTSAILAGIVGVMLVIAWANLSGLLLVRTMARHREIGVRLALGSGRWRVVRLSLLEAGMLSLAGAVTGLAIALALLKPALFLFAFGQHLRLPTEYHMIAVTGGLCILTALACGLAPLLWIIRLEPLAAIAGWGNVGRAPLRWGEVFVVVQLALTLFAVTLAYALGDELSQSLAINPGVERMHVITARFSPADAGYTAQSEPGLCSRLKSNVSAIPGVVGVGFSANGFLTFSKNTSGIFVRNPHARIHSGQYLDDSIDPDYLRVMGATLLKGRGLDQTDYVEKPHATVVSNAFAREVFGNINPIGERFGYGSSPSDDDWNIVGVVGDTRINGIREAAPAVFFTPPKQWLRSMNFIAVRFSGSPDVLRAELRKTLSAVEPALIFSNWQTVQERITDTLGVKIATSRIAVACAGGALLLAAIGLASSLAFLVTLRGRDIAMRIAVGAEPAAIVRLILLRALRIGVLGCTVGLVGVWLIPTIPIVRSLLPSRPELLPALVATAICLTVACLAGMLPARKAARIDPLSLLKTE